MENGCNPWSALVRILAVLLSFNAAVGAAAQDRRQGEPGEFVFYVLALSWSPSYCEASRDRSPNRPPDRQCAGRPFAFVVHGLWPQYERGFPSYCQVPAPRLNHTIVGRILDLMPSPRLVFHEWDRHGTCSGLNAQAYFETVRKARAAVTIPAGYVALSQPTSVSPANIINAFISANPALSRDAISVACDGKRLTEVHICLSKDLSFHDCGQLSRRGCRRDNIVMPAVRGG